MLTAVLREPGTVGPGDFHTQKLRWHGNADVVLAGCSRINLGVSPAVLSDYLRGRVLNFAFDSNGYSAAYLDRLTQVLDPKSPHPTIILGVQPGNFTVQSEVHNAFVTEMQRQKNDESRISRLPQMRPMELTGWRVLGLGGKPRLSNKRQYCNGWSPMTVRPVRHHKALAKYQRLWEKTDVEERLMSQLLDRVRVWTDAGIRVYAFRPPSSPDVMSLEREQSGFDEATFRRRFAAAGGHWLTVPQCAYRTFDGVHLDADEAERFSADLGRMLAHDLATIGDEPQWVQKTPDGR